MTTEAVTNAGPLLVLAKLNRLALLPELYARVAVPLPVYTEVVTVGQRRGYQDARITELFLDQVGWRPVPCPDIPGEIADSQLDDGEKAAIALALSRNCPLLMDEEIGRVVARQQGLAVHGSLGILIRAFRRSLITETELRLDFGELSTRADVWISPTLCSRLLKRVLEQN